MSTVLPKFKKGWLGGKSNLPVSSPMGKRWGKNHDGVDFAVSVGTYIEAPFNGTIISACKKTGWGLQLVLRNKINDKITIDVRFAHLSKIESIAEIGKSISAGTKIAKTGGKKGDPNAGNSQGPHLHLEVMLNGKFVNPISFIEENCFSTATKNIIKITSTSQKTENSFNTTTIEEVNTSTSEAQETDVSSITTSETEYNPPRKKVGTANTSERLAPGIWQIVKLIMDSSVRDREIVDSSISMMTGSLKNWFDKVCQQPFVEFCGDTYGDQYFFFVRKPPFDLEGVNRGINYSSLHISDNEIISKNLSWNNQGIYSWYQLIPYAETMGMENVTFYLPAIFFPEYAAVWGSKNLTVQSQYVSLFSREYLNSDSEKKKQENGENIMRNTIADLKYLIDCNAYAPFVRRGTITLNGDRRIKRGMFIILDNDEVFYVDSVSNNLTIREGSYNRTTTLNVSHGMFLQFINGVEVKEFQNEKISYFNIIDYGKDFSLDKLKEGNYNELISNWKVNFNVFSFFLSKYQMIYNMKN